MKNQTTYQVSSMMAKFIFLYTEPSHAHTNINIPNITYPHIPKFKIMREKENGKKMKRKEKK